MWKDFLFICNWITLLYYVKCSKRKNAVKVHRRFLLTPTWLLHQIQVFVCCTTKKINTYISAKMSTNKHKQVLKERSRNQWVKIWHRISKILDNNRWTGALTPSVPASRGASVLYRTPAMGLSSAQHPCASRRAAYVLTVQSGGF